MSRLRLVKAEETNFTIKGTWYFEVDSYGDDGYSDEPSLDEPWIHEEYVDEAISFAEEDFESVKDILLEQCNDECQEDEKVENIRFSLGIENSYMDIYCNKNLSEETKERIKEQVIGQYADGWGEGLEQQMFKSFEDENGMTNELAIKLWTPEINYEII